jgi:DNA-binding XRE family transcriptional regulator
MTSSILKGAEGEQEQGSQKEMKTLDEKLKALPAARRRKIEKRAAQLIAEEMTMRELRKARHMTQAKMARSLGVKQEQISRIEKRTDLHISTLRRSIEAMGGKLSIVAEFPDGAPVVLTGLGR